MKEYTNKQVEEQNYPSTLQSNFYIPETNPKFDFVWGADVNVFSIGSCFAREIEVVLQEHGCCVNSLSPLVSFEGEGFPVSLLNEYNPGSMAQRINWAFNSEDLGERGIVKRDDRYVDLLINSEKTHNKEWVLSRRRRIQEIYKHLPKSNLVVITLGLTEAWYDTQEQIYLNRIPPFDNNDRYVLRVLDVKDCLDLLEPAIKQFTDREIPVLLSVSPIPLTISFTGEDAVIANENSKSTLRLVAKQIAENNHLVDYFPSYEAFRTQGLIAFLEDGKHVKFPLVEKTVNEMVKRYQA